MDHPELLFGGGNIGHGKFSTTPEVQNLLSVLMTKNVNRIDTAALYPLDAIFASETLLGETKTLNGNLVFDTKILLAPDFTGDGALQPRKIDDSISGSMARLGQKINVVYCHCPDSQTPLEETAASLQKHFEAGHFSTLGLSNYSLEQIKEFLAICEDKGYVKPSVYQGQYNAICRQPEAGLFDFLRAHGMAFVAYSPLAGGFLTGKLTNGQDLTGTRFEPGSLAGNFLRASFDKPSFHTAVRKLESVIKPQNLDLPGVSLRWLYFHSALNKNDGIILGASTIEQLGSNIKALGKGLLDPEIVAVFEEVWDLLKKDAS